MKKVLVVVLAVAIIVVGGVVFAVAKNSSNTTDSSTNTDSTASASSSTAKTATNSVTIQDFAFSPANITVKTGTKVTWTNKDSMPHTVTETDSLNGPKSDTLSPGQSYSFTFTAPGTYHYHCTIHSGMTGTVTVTE